MPHPLFFQAKRRIEDVSTKVDFFGEHCTGGEDAVSFEEVLDQASAMLQRRGRLTYRTLKRQFHLDAEALEDLTFELIKGQRLAVEEDGAVLVWIGEPLGAKPDSQGMAEAESRFHAVLPDVMGLLQRERRVTYRRLTYVFGLDEVLLEDLREELVLRRVAIDEAGKVLVWTGEAPPVVPSVVAAASQPAALDSAVVSPTSSPTRPPRVTERLSGNMPWQKSRFDRELAHAPSVQECALMIQAGQGWKKELSDLTDEQWTIVEPLISSAQQSPRGGRPRKVTMRGVLRRCCP